MFHSPKSHVCVKQIIREWLPYVWSEPDSSCKTRMHPAMSFSVWPFVLAALDTVYGGIKISAWQCTCVPGQGTKTSTNISLLYSSFLSPSPNNKCLIFFLERTQRVIHGPATFEFCHVTSGVLQRSVLSPRLFTIYMLPRGDILRKNKMSFHCYSTDTNYIKTCAIPVIERCALRKLNNGWLSFFFSF